MKILIATPVYENAKPDHFKAIWNLDRCGHDVDYDYIVGHGVQRARNDIAKLTLSGGYDKLLTVDSDVILPSNALELLLQDHGKIDVLLGVYQNRYKGRKGYATLYVDMGKKRQADNGNILSIEKIESLKPGRIKITAGGLGCALIDANVFRMMKYPYFLWEEGNNWECSEDCYFCFKAAEAGARIRADIRVLCQHVTKVVL